MLQSCIRSLSTVHLSLFHSFIRSTLYVCRIISFNAIVSPLPHSGESPASAVVSQNNKIPTSTSKSEKHHDGIEKDESDNTGCAHQPPNNVMHILELARCSTSLTVSLHSLSFYLYISLYARPYYIYGFPSLSA